MANAPQKPAPHEDTVRLLRALQRLHSAVDVAMGDRDLPNDDGELMRAMQQAAPFIGDAADLLAQPPVRSEETGVDAP